jgi:hypothetical protein
MEHKYVYIIFFLTIVGIITVVIIKYTSKPANQINYS